MKSLLYPARLWQRLLVWLLTVFLCYIPLVAVACVITDSCNYEPHPEAIWSLPESFFVFSLACMLAPAIAIIAELLAFLLPGRVKMGAMDYLVSMLLLPIIHGLALRILCDFIRISGSWPPAPCIAGWSAAALTLLSIALPPVAGIKHPWGYTLTATLICWMWGLSFAVLIGAIIDCFIRCGHDPVAIFPYSLLQLPFITLAGLIPALIPYSIINTMKR